MIAVLVFSLHVLLLSYFVFFATYNYLYSAFALLDRKPRTRAHNNPKVAVVIVSYNESNVIEDTVKACERLTYKNAQVILADDSDTGVAVEVLRNIREKRGARLTKFDKYANRPHIKIYEAAKFTLFHREKKSGFKAGCLKDLEDYLRVKGFEYMYLLDAEWHPQEDAVERLLETIFADKRLAFVQSRRENAHGNMRFLQRCIALSDNGCYYTDLAGRQAFGDPVLFTGCCTLFRLKHLYKVGGFLPGHLTEDIDLTNRLYLAGFKGAYVENVKNMGEVPPNYYAFRLQQDRWTSGTARALKDYFWPILKSKHLRLHEKLGLLRQNMYYTSAIAIELSILVSLLSLVLMVGSADNIQGALFISYMYQVRYVYSFILVAALFSGVVPVAITCVKRKTLKDLWVIPFSLWISWSLLHTYFVANIKGFLHLGQSWFLTPKSNRGKRTIQKQRNPAIRLINAATLAILIVIYGTQWVYYSRLDPYMFFWVPALVQGIVFS